MKIGLVAEPYEATGYSGMGYSVLETMRHLPVAGPNYQYVFYSSTPISKDAVRVPFENVIIPRGFLRQLLWFFFYKGDADALLFVAPLLPLILPRRVKTFQLCKELSNLHIKQKGFKNIVKTYIHDSILMPISLRRATAIFASSEATARDVAATYGTPREKIFITYEGFQDLTNVPSEAVPNIPEVPYFLFVGRLKNRKNLHGVVDAWLALRARGSNAHLVVVGKGGGTYEKEQREKITQAKADDAAHFLGFASQGMLRTLYERATAFVFPSFSEGFGMPAMEAMSLGTPVITSNRSSLPEIAEGAALLVNPDDPTAISNAMEQLLKDTSLRAKLAAEGRQRATRYSWSKVADAYISHIESSFA